MKTILIKIHSTEKNYCEDDYSSVLNHLPLEISTDVEDLDPADSQTLQEYIRDYNRNSLTDRYVIVTEADITIRKAIKDQIAAMNKLRKQYEEAEKKRKEEAEARKQKKLLKKQAKNEAEEQALLKTLLEKHGDKIK